MGECNVYLLRKIYLTDILYLRLFYILALTTAHSCAEHRDLFHHTESGVYDININPDPEQTPDMVYVYCDMVTDEGKWMVSIVCV